MSDLYKQALLEAKKVREIAEQDAKKSLVEAMTPLIKNMISKQINENFYLEQDEEEDPLAAVDATTPAAPPAPVAPATTPKPGAAAAPASEPVDTTGIGDLGAGLGDSMDSAPLAPAGDSDVINASMPDAEGKITVDFEDLFSGAVEDDLGVADDDLGGLDLGDSSGEIPSTPEADPMAAAPAPGGEEQGLDLSLEDEPIAAEAAYNKFRNSLHEVSDKIDYVFFNGSPSEFVTESLKERLFGLVGHLDKLKENGSLSGKMFKSNENKLEFLFLKLKEANLNNSYNRDQKDTRMTSLKEFAQKILFEDVTDVESEDTNQGTTADGKHAAKVSGVGPDIGTTDDLDASATSGNSSGINEEMSPGAAGSVDEEPLPGTNPKPGTPKQWADGEPDLHEKDQDKMIEEALAALDEEIDAEGSAGFGDTSENPPVEFEVNEKEIAEAVEALQKESIRKKIAAIKEASDGKKGANSWEDAEPEGGNDPSHDNLKEAADLFEMFSEDDEEGEDDMDDMDDMGEEMTSDDMMGDDSEDMMGDDDGDLVLSIDLPDEVEDALASVDVSAFDDISVDLVDVGFGSEDDVDIDDIGGDTEMSDVMSGDVGGDDMAPPMSPEEDMEEAAVYEAKLRKAGKLYKEAKAKVEKLEADLQEANLFIAKNVFFTKLMQRGDLSKKNLKKVVEHLDRAKTVAEAKSTYGKIKAKLAESTERASKKLVGSSATVTKPGSASLNESVTRKTQDSNDPTVGSVDRWQQLAGIRKKG